MLLTSKNFVFPILRRKKKITPANGGGGWPISLEIITLYLPLS